MFVHHHHHRHRHRLCCLQAESTNKHTNKNNTKCGPRAEDHMPKGSNSRNRHRGIVAKASCYLLSVSHCRGLISFRVSYLGDNVASHRPRHAQKGEEPRLLEVPPIQHPRPDPALRARPPRSRHCCLSVTLCMAGARARHRGQRAGCTQYHAWP